MSLKVTKTVILDGKTQIGLNKCYDIGIVTVIRLSPDFLTHALHQLKGCFNNSRLHMKHGTSWYNTNRQLVLLININT